MPPTCLPPFDRVVADHGDVVWRVCRALLGPVDADDAWSETFLAALGAYPALRPDSNVRGWLVTIAHRKAIDAHRARARRPPPTDVLGDVAAPASTDRLDADLVDALAELTERQRRAVVYHHLAGLPHAEVAALLETTPAAARRSAADGIAHLRRRFPKGRPS